MKVPTRTHLRTTGFLLMVILVPALARSGQSQGSSHLPTLTTAAQIRELTPEQANRGYTVRLRAVITYIDLAHGDFFAQDATAGIYVNESNKDLSFQPGDFLEIEGVTEEPDFAPQIGKARYRRLGQAPLPRPRTVSVDDMLSTREDSQWVQIDGIVQDLEPDNGNLKLDVAVEGRRLQVTIVKPTGLNGDRLVDAKVRLAGVCAAFYNRNNQLTGVRLAVPTSRQFTMIEPPPADPFSVPVRPINSLLTFTARNTSEHRVHVQGTVTLQRRRGVFIQDGRQGLYIPSLPREPLRPGDRVDVVGFADLGDYTPVLRYAVFKRTGSAAIPPPLEITAQGARTGAYDTLRVRLDGTLRDVRHSETDHTFVLQDGDVLFEARIDEGKATRDWSRPIGSRLRLTGICSVNVDRNRTPDTFNILLDSPDSIVVLARPSWWTITRVSSLLVVFAAIILVGTLWVRALRRRIEERTEALRATLESTADGILVVSPTGKFTGYNRKFAEMFQVPVTVLESRDHEAALNLFLRQLQDPSAFLARIQQKCTDQEAQSDDLIEGYDGRVFEQHLEPQRVKGKSVGRVLGFRDISERKKAEAALIEERHLLHTLMDNLPDQIYFKDLKSRITRTNKANAAKLGLDDPAQAVGKTDFDFFTEGHAQPAFADEQEIIKTGQAMLGKEEKETWADGHETWVSTTKMPLRDAQGRIIGTFGVSRDITERKRAEEELLFKTTLLEAEAETTLDGILVADQDGKVIFANGRFREMWNIPEDVLPPQPHAAFIRHGSTQPKDSDAFLGRLAYLYANPMEKALDEFEFQDGRIIDRYSSPLLGPGDKYYGRIWYLRDITARKRAEEALQESEARYRGLFENSLEGIGLSQGNKVIDANRALLDIFGYNDLEEFKAIPLLEHVAPQSQILIKEIMEKRARGEPYPQRFEYEVTRKDREMRTLEISAGAVLLGGQSYTQSIFRDITERRRAEEALRQSEVCLAAGEGLSHTGSWVLELASGELFWSKEVYRIFGFDPAKEKASVRDTFLARIHPEDRPRIEEGIHAAPNRTAQFGTDYRIVLPDGSIRYLHEVVYPVTDDTGKVIKRFGAVSDVTERKCAETALRESEARFRTLIEEAPLGIRISRNGLTVYTNQKYLAMYGYQCSDELVGLHLFDQWAPECRPEIAERVRQRSRGLPLSPSMEGIGQRRDGSQFPVHVDVTRVDLPDGPASLSFFTDITERRRAEKALRESEARFRTLIENAPTAISISRDRMTIYANYKFREMHGYQEVEEIVGRPVGDFCAPACREMIVEFSRQHSPGKPVPLRYEAMAQRKDGSEFPVEIHVTRVGLPDGPANLAFLTDITERKRAEEALAASEARFRSYFELPLIGMAITSAEKRFLAANDRFCAILGYSGDELMQMDWARLTHPDDLATCVFQFNRVLSGEIDGYSLDKRFIRKDGGIIWASIATRCVRKPDGTVDYICTVLQDITERKHVDERIKQSEEKFRKAFMTAADACYIATLHGALIFEANERFEDVFGYSREEAIGKTSIELGLYVDPCERKRLVAEIERNGYARNLEFKCRRKDGKVIDLLLSANLLKGFEEAMILGAARDVTEQKSAQESLVRLRKAVDASGEVIFMTDRQGVFTFVNPEFTDLYGYTEEEVVDKATPRILKSGRQPPEKDSAFWQTLLGKRVARGQIINKAKDGRLLTMHSSVSPIVDESGITSGFLAIQRDITEYKRLEEQFIQAQKMEAVGRLAAGVAHDFNNLLTIINGHSALMLKQLPTDNPARESFTDIKDAGERAAALTRQLLAFSRQQVRTSTVLNLNTLVSDSAKMLRRLIGEDIELVFEPAPDVGMVCVDAGQIEQVLMNMAVNSRDAMPQGGKLTIEVSNFQADEGHAATHYPLPPDSYVMLAVSDTGCGMDAATQARIFEPFFTTKEQGKGTGLGLATVYGIVKQNGGYIWVHSELGCGTTFKIYLPVAAGEAQTSEARRDSFGGSETVLLVEDEVKVRSLARRMLESEGYKVLEASGGMEALLIASQRKGPVHLLLTDVVMPLMSGRELAQRLAKLHPQMKILYMSGYTDDTILRHGALESGVAFLQKPFAPEVLARKVREVLDA